MDILFRKIDEIYDIKRHKTLCELCGGDKIINLLQHRPVNAIDRRSNQPIIGQIITIIIYVKEYIFSNTSKVLCTTDSYDITLVFFKVKTSHIKSILPIGQKRVVSGRFEKFNNTPQIIHPDYILPINMIDTIYIIEPIYPLKFGIKNKDLRKMINAISIPRLPEWISADIIDKYEWKSWKTCMEQLHNPESVEDITDPNSKIRSRLAYDELLGHKIMLYTTQKRTQKRRIIAGNNKISAIIREKLGFELTQDQEKCIQDIKNDQQSENCMLRLLQGDVGSGKTIVALFAIINAIEANTQAALMAPTEILAIQHAEYLQNILIHSGIKVALLTGKTRTSERKDILLALAAGTIQIVVGTHALFQENVVFRNLSLAIIDEQHRFGVDQRASLIKKGQETDILLMSATPIPRTLALTLYGNIDQSIIAEKPKGRKKIKTSTMNINKIDRIIDKLTQNNAQTYWICPLIEDSEDHDIANAEERFRYLHKTFGDKVGLVHGKIPIDERIHTITQFQRNIINILVATTVIEVGINAPNASIIIIEQAERFGLSQLHQLRGRVGRGDIQSFCILLYNRLNQKAAARLEIMRNSDDGFFIAERDLELRGSGDLLGIRQSGFPEFKFASYHHRHLLPLIEKNVNILYKSENNSIITLLLKTFGYDDGNIIN